MSDPQNRRSDASNDSIVEPRKEWKFTQWFKKMPTQGMMPDADTLSAVSFDAEGKFLATGDRGGRIVVLESDPIVGKTKPGGIHFKFHAEFQSHEAEFDYVRSLAVEERISKIRWLTPTNDALFLLSTNDRAIKLWKVHRKPNDVVTSWNIDRDTGKGPSKPSELRLPHSESAGDSVVVATLKRNFAPDVHAFHINSLAVTSDGETFMSADNLRINLWNANIPDKAFNIIDTKPANMQDLTEVITCADAHPSQCHTFLYATSKGTVRLGDTRERAVLDHFTKVFASADAAQPGQGNNQEKSFFSDVTLSISDAKFTPNGTGMVTRDFMTVKVWDLRVEKKPLETICVHEYLRPKLWDLYENDCVYDGFEVGISSEGNIATGSYNNYFHVYDLKSKTDTWAEASKVPMGVFPINPALWQGGKNGVKKKRASRTGARGLFSRKHRSKDGKDPVLDPKEDAGPTPPPVNPENLDYASKVLHCAWHPKVNCVAVAGANNLFLYSAANTPPS